MLSIYIAFVNEKNNIFWLEEIDGFID